MVSNQNIVDKAKCLIVSMVNGMKQNKKGTENQSKAVDRDMEWREARKAKSDIIIMQTECLDKETETKILLRPAQPYALFVIIVRECASVFF